MAVASRSSSEPTHRVARVRGRAICLGVVCAVVAALGSPGCVTVRPEEREFLADPAMTFGGGGESTAHEEHVFSNREGSYGAGNVTGGGCGCN